MTAHVDDHSMPTTERRTDRRAAQDRGAPRTIRPRWLLPGLAAVFVVAGLVLAGVLSLSTVLYFGLFVGMILMHAGGHAGHGGHGGHGGEGTHQGHGGGTTPDAGDLSHRSHRSQLGRPGSDEAPEDRASINPNGDERPDHGQHSPHGCH